MKRIYLLAAILLLSATTLVQAQNFDVGVKKITATTALVIGYNIPITISYEQGIVDFGGNHKLGVGGLIGTGGSYTLVAAQCNYHYVGFEKFDLYGGARLGYRSLDNVKGMNSTFAIGSNYYFAPSWAINAELESGVTSISVGIAYRF
ncbi:MAG: hypothetical protein SNI51_00405 [Rikenellaceae bacterium]